MVIRVKANCTSGVFCHVSADSTFFASDVGISSQIFAISILMFTCLLGNCLLCFAVYRSPTRRSAASILLLNLAIADFLVGCLVLPMWILATTDLGWPLSDNMCEFVAFTTVVLMLCSIFSLCAISVDRYCNIAMPLRYPMEVTLQRITMVVVAVWVYCILVASSPLFGWGDYRFQPQTVPICNPVWVTEISFAVFLVLSGMALPVALMLFSYIKIILIARDHIRRIDTIHRQLENPIKERLDNSHRINEELPVTQSKFSKSLKMVQRVFIAVGVFFLCWGPYVILNFWSVNHETIPVPYVADLLVTLLAFANSSINPVIFIVLNKDFRHSIRELKTRMTPCFNDDVVRFEGTPEHVYQVAKANGTVKNVTLVRNSEGLNNTVLSKDKKINSSNDNDMVKNNGATSTSREPPHVSPASQSPKDDLINCVDGPTDRPGSKLSRTKSFRNLPGIADPSLPKWKFGVKRETPIKRTSFRTMVNAYSALSLSEIKRPGRHDPHPHNKQFPISRSISTSKRHGLKSGLGTLRHASSDILALVDDA